MVWLLVTDLPVQSAYYGSMFNVHASEDLEIVAIHAISEDNIRIRIHANKAARHENTHVGNIQGRCIFLVGDCTGVSSPSVKSARRPVCRVIAVSIIMARVHVSSRYMPIY